MAISVLSWLDRILGSGWELIARLVTNTGWKTHQFVWNGIVLPPPLSETIEVLVSPTTDHIIEPTLKVASKDDIVRQPRTWSVEHTLILARQLTQAIALLRADTYSQVAKYIDEYIITLNSTDPQFALVSLRQLRERLDIFAKQNTSERLKEATTLYWPPSDVVFSWFRDSPYKITQSEYIKVLDARKYIVPLLNVDDWALTNILKLSIESQKIVHSLRSDLTALSSSVSHSTMYNKYFGKLDSNIVWVLYQWEILDPRLDPMLVEYFAWKKHKVKMWPILKELLYMNLIYRVRTPKSETLK